MFVNWLDVGKLKSCLELILVGHEVLMRSTLTYNATYILEDCALEAKFHHKYHNDRDRELSLVIKMYYFNIRHIMIVTIFYSFVSFNIFTQDSSIIKNKEGGLYFQHFRWYLDGGLAQLFDSVPYGSLKLSTVGRGQELDG